MTDAEQRLAAAALLRRHAAALNPPWEVHVGVGRDVCVRQVPRDHEQIACYTGYAADDKDTSYLYARYIATMHPGVGKKLANLLEQSVIDGIGVDMPGFLEDALDAVARAIIGTDQRHSAQPGTDTAPGDQGTVPQ